MNILILTDFSSTAYHAGKYAVDLFREKKVNFYLLNIQDLNFRGTPPKLTLLELKQLSQEQIQNQLQELRENSTQCYHEFFTIISEENLVAATRRYVIEKKIDLIVMGTTFTDFETKSILDKHTREIIQKIKCNILAISEKNEFQIPKRLVLPVDSFINMESDMIQFLKDNIFNKDTSVTIMEIGLPFPKMRKNLSIKDYFGFDESSHQCNFLEFKKTSNLSEILFDEIQEYYNMIIILGKNLSICNKLLHAQNGDWATSKNKLPVLVLHEKF